MQELDKNKAYDLSKIDETELQEVIDWLDENKLDSQISLCNSEFIKEKIKNGRYLHYYKDMDGDLLWGFEETNKEPTNAKELFYTLENIQVDCSELTEEQIKEMCKVFEKSGYKYFENNKKYALKVIQDSCFLRTTNREIIVDTYDIHKTTITYEKFMELFGDKKAPLKRNYETLVGGTETTDEVTPLRLSEVIEGYIKAQENLGELLREEVSRQPTIEEVSSIFSAHEEKESEKRSLKIKVLKYLLKRDIILTPKQYKKLWKK